MSDNSYKSCGDNKCEGKYLRGVCCDVKTCIYHDCDEHCTASKIMIGPSFAKSSGDTICSTFKPRA